MCFFRFLLGEGWYRLLSSLGNKQDASLSLYATHSKVFHPNFLNWDLKLRSFKIQNCLPSNSSLLTMIVHPQFFLLFLILIAQQPLFCCTSRRSAHIFTRALI